MVLYVAMVLFWASGFLGATMAAETGAGADTTLWWRYLLTAAMVLVVVGVRRRRYPPRFLAREAVIGVLAQGLYLYGVFGAAALGVPTGTNALIASLQPLLVAVVASWLVGARLQVRTTLGLLAGLAGVAVVAGADLGAGRGGLAGLGLSAAGMVALSGGTLLADRWPTPAGLDLVDRLSVHALVAFAFFTAVVVPAGGLRPPADPQFWWAQAVVVLGAFVGGYGVYLLVLQRSGPVVSSALLYLTPGAAAALAWPAFGETISLVVLLGFGLSAVGVVGVVRRRPDQPSPGADEPVGPAAVSAPRPAGR